MLDLKRCFKSFHNFPGHGYWLVPIVSTLLLVLLSLEFMRGVRLGGPVKYSLQAQDAPLTCGQVVEIGRWSTSRYGGPIKVDMQTSDFSRRVVDTFVDKLDPHKLIFTAGEVEQFKLQAVQSWQSVIKHGRCDAFEKDISAKFETAKTRVHSLVAGVNFKGKLGIRSEEAQSISDKAPHYKTFAKDNRELTSRLTQFGDRIAEFTNPRVLPAYSGSVRKLISDSLDQLLFADPLQPRNALAKAMLGSLDPFSTYLSSSEFDDFYQELAGGTTGVGIKVRKVPQGLLVEKVLKDSPADKSHALMVGAILISVDGQSIKESSLQVSKKMLKGAENSVVKLEWVEPVSNRVRSTVLTRASFSHEESRITHRMAMNQGRPVAIIEIPSFYGRGGFETVGSEEHSSAEDLEKIVSQLMAVKGKDRVTSIILDLRGNPGGFLEEAVSMGGLFLGNRPVVGVVEREDRRVLRDHRAAMYNGPLVVLLDNESASASEVLAGALKDHQRAIVIGESASYGKGSVQRLFHLQDELTWINPMGQLWSGVVKLTTSIFYSPLGHSPANGGVSPNLRIAAVSHASEDYEAKPKKSWTVPETTPFLESDDLRSIQKNSRTFRKKLDLLKNRNPWLAKASTSPSKAVEYLNSEVDSDESGDAEDELLDKAVNVASDFVFVDQVMNRSTLSALH